jgi:hypothetical protein
VRTVGAPRIGYWLSLFSVLLGLAYLGLAIAALASGTFPPAGLCQTLMNVVIMLTIPSVVLLWVVVHQVTPAGKQVFSLGSLVLLAIFATPTSINRYNALTIVPQAMTMGRTEGLQWFLPYGGPSIMVAMEMLSWGIYYGLACLCLAPVFGGNRLEKAISWTLIASGGLSFVSILGQVLNNVLLSMPGVLAWGPGLILLTVLLALWFRAQTNR